MTIWNVFESWGGEVKCTADACAIKPPDVKRLVINLTNGGREAVDEFVHRFDAVVVNVDGDEHEFDAKTFVGSLEAACRNGGDRSRDQLSDRGELKPCPFCGGKAKVMRLDLDSIDEGWKLWGVWCEDDLNDEYSHGHYIDNYATEEEAVAAWNRREEL